MTKEQEKRCEEAFQADPDREYATPHSDEWFKAGYAAAVERELPQWRPIEEAPKDGTDILLSRLVRGKKATRWEVYSVFWVDEEDLQGNPGGYWADGFEETPLLPGGMTHWMPLPAPPEEVEG